MIFSDLPSPAEAGFAQAGNRYPLFGIMLCVVDQPWRTPLWRNRPATQRASRDRWKRGRSVFVRINQWFGMTQLIVAD
jgi:hypothetical protein